MPLQLASTTGDIPGPQLIVGEIHFYRANENPFGAFSNLYPSPIMFDGELYPTAEHAYQAGKAAKAAVRKWVLSAPSPALVAMAAHGLYSWDVVPNWATIKFERMRRVLLAKYQQHADLRILLLSTGDARLVESANTNNAVNRLWGEVNGKGQNMLGKLLMDLRAELRIGATESPGEVLQIPAKKVALQKVDVRAANKASRVRKIPNAQSI